MTISPEGETRTAGGVSHRNRIAVLRSPEGGTNLNTQPRLITIPFNEGDVTLRFGFSVGSLQLGRWHKPLACGHAEHRPEAYATETLASLNGIALNHVSPSGLLIVAFRSAKVCQTLLSRSKRRQWSNSSRVMNIESTFSSF